MRIAQNLMFFSLFLCFPFFSTAQKPIPAKDSISVNQDSVYSNKDVDVIAEYPGGDMSRRNFLERNINGQVATDNGAPSGNYTVVVICFIGIDGKITEAVPETSHGYGMEKEVLRIINKLPKPYKPAMKNGVPVKSKIKFPVTFSVLHNVNRV